MCKRHKYLRYTMSFSMFTLTVVLFIIGIINCIDTSSQQRRNPSLGDRDVVGDIDAVFDKADLGRNAALLGHMQPLGAHRPPEKNGIDVLDSVPQPVVFFDKYVKDGKPVLFRGAAKNMLAFKLWTDDYLRSKYGTVEVEVEVGKKENRSQEVWTMPLADYIDQYQHRDVYLVHSVPTQMADDFGLIRCLQCGFSDYLQDAVIWYSSGGTKSVLHFDMVDNINCVMDGEKELFLVDRRESKHVHIDNPTGAFSGVDVDKVDMHKYPGLGKVPWYNVTMQPGDCFFIPYKWFHHVHSQGRNLAVNIWFVHMLQFDRMHCEQTKGLSEYVPLSKFQMASNNGQIRVELVDIIDQLEVDFIQQGDIPHVASHLELALDKAQSVFDILDLDKDKQVSLDEIYNCNIHDLASFFPDNDIEEVPHDEL